MNINMSILGRDLVAREILETAKSLTSVGKPHIFSVRQLSYLCSHSHTAVRMESAKLLELPDYFLIRLLKDRSRLVRYEALKQIRLRKLAIKVSAEFVADLVQAGLLTRNGRLRAVPRAKGISLGNASV